MEIDTAELALVGDLGDSTIVSPQIGAHSVQSRKGKADHVRLSRGDFRGPR